MDKILLNKEELGILTKEDFPMMIHGEDKSGASFYTICLAAKWFLQGNKVIFLCGYHMAQDSFEEQVGKEHVGAIFYTKEKAQEQEFRMAVSKKFEDNMLLIIKNIELFGPEELSCISNFQNVIVSGDILRSTAKNEILKKEFATKIYFSELPSTNLPPLAKYEAFVISKNHQGITKIEK